MANSNSDKRFLDTICNDETKRIIHERAKKSIDLIKEEYLKYKELKYKEKSLNASIGDSAEESLTNKLGVLGEKLDENKNKYTISHPLDDDVLKKLTEIKNDIRDDDDDYRIFVQKDVIIDLWKTLISKSIKCLRFFDKREPFIENAEKNPLAYGTEELYEYFDKYINFESVLYGSAKYYRDHVIHMFRVWMLGIHCLLDKNESDNNKIYLDDISLGTDSNGEEINVTPLEKISIWTLIALTHDLGYPLEKSQQIIEKTKSMMSSFVSNPILSLDLSFSGVQNNMNDFVLRFISSKMNNANTKCPKDDTSTASDKFVARLQPKYYYKFQKSLEKNEHGVISALVIYKLLIYFLESDFNINEDYEFDQEDSRQFYIRREILRSISAHTCRDIYHLDMNNFAFFLIVIDDSQDWGRKSQSELYVDKTVEYEFGDVVLTKNQGKSDEKECIINETFSFPKIDHSQLDSEKDIKNLFNRLKMQFKTYNMIFRDGQDTSKRDFHFLKECKIETHLNNSPIFNVKFDFPSKSVSKFQIELDSSSCGKKNSVKSVYDSKFIEKMFDNKDVKVEDISSKESNSKEFHVIFNEML
ncbi:hypothetical protein [Ruminococcus flavefaciens]|uniref:hypothetical protein n=1 Tax=Ruminococcus flavefaciens TaxID=1265 RepID=UPI0026F31DE9|nr:hypothetical protein [Ruminococcus flavefaciens]